MTTFQLAFYKGTKSGIAGIYNWLVRKRGRGPYSHVEVCFTDGMCASSSFMDHGVRFKQMDPTQNPDKWDFIILPAYLEADARKFFIDHEGEGYDIWGNVHLTIGFVSESANKLFCSEAVAASLQISEPWRLEPNALYHVVHRIVYFSEQFQRS